MGDLVDLCSLLPPMAGRHGIVRPRPLDKVGGKAVPFQHMDTAQAPGGSWVKVSTYVRQHGGHHDTVLRRGERGELRVEKRWVGNRELWMVWDGDQPAPAEANPEFKTELREGPAPYHSVPPPNAFTQGRQITVDAFVHGRRVSMEGLDEAQRRALEGWDIALAEHIDLVSKARAQAAIIRYIRDGVVPEDLTAAQ